MGAVPLRREGRDEIGNQLPTAGRLPLFDFEVSGSI